ncbi:MAG: septal ring lytic transglycosylase RlpA family protein [Acidobacteriota bacterium]|nr:septal ring lytic transglycosylase RlpA family protein [Acidobacteriota bacterium]
MVIRRNASNVNRKDPLQFWLLVAASCVALAGMVITLPAKTVQANAILSAPSATAPSATAATNPTPALAGPARAEDKTTDNMLHGIASWYGGVFNGRPTASGERFDMYAMTACHPTLPFGTRVRVTDAVNHRSVVVRITDRGDLEPGRIIDLSYGAAKKLHMTKAGLAPVKLEVLALGRSSSDQ